MMEKVISLGAILASLSRLHDANSVLGFPSELDSCYASVQAQCTGCKT